MTTDNGIRATDEQQLGRLLVSAARGLRGWGGQPVHTTMVVYASVFAAYLDPHRILRNVIFYNAFVFHFTIYITAFAGHT